MSQDLTRYVHGISRRRLLQATSAISISSLATGGIRVTAAQTPAVAPSGEAPILAEQVSAGSLPPLAERLPANPMVLTPIEEIGQYGGRIRRAMTTPEDSNNFMPLVRTSLLEWSLDQNYDVVPSLADSFEVSDDATLYTFHLREGIRWSDGEPFTVDDLMFYYDDVLQNEEITVAPPTWLVTEGELATFTKIDDLTLEVQFAHPQGLFPRYLCFAGWMMIVPKHYMSQFHPAYVDQAELDAVVEEEGVDLWTTLFEAKNSIFTNPERPVLGAWVMAEPIVGSATRATAIRNPYYWKVDPEGNQLPYVDDLTFDVIDQVALVLRAANGEIDLQHRHISFRDMPVLQDGAQTTGTYEVRQWQSDAPWIAMYMNQSYTEPAVRELLQNVDFRAGLSHAINRAEMNEILFLGLGGTQQPCALPADPYFVEGYGNRFTEYNVETANQLLDAAGLTERGGDGFRLRPDGQPLELSIQYFVYENSGDAYQLVKGYWEQVGIKVTVEEIDRTLWAERVQGNQVAIPGYTVAGLLWDIDPLWYVPVSQSTYWAPGFGTHYASGGESGEEPSELAAQLQGLYEQMVATGDDAERLRLGQEILAVHDENVFMIGTVTAPFLPTVVNTSLGNVYQETVSSYRVHNEGVTAFEQVFYRNA